MSSPIDAAGDGIDNETKDCELAKHSVPMYRAPRVGIVSPDLARRVAIAKLRHELRRNARANLASTAGEDVPSSVFAEHALSPSELAPEGARSPSLESIGITDLASDAPALHLDASDPYMREVERETASFRVSRARRSYARANAIAARELEEALPPELDDGHGGWTRRDEPAGVPHTPLEVLTASEARRAKAAWHVSRGRGSLERFPRVRDCGLKKTNSRRNKAIATCTRSCGLIRKIDLGCCVGRLCLECRAAAATFRKQRLLEAQNRIMKRLRRSGLASKYRGDDRWGAKFFTLTAPHCSVEDIAGMRELCESRGIGELAMTVAARVLLVREAWRYFSIELQKWAKLEVEHVRHRARVAWYRAFEWTPGGDEHGHPHFHVWIVCPYLPQELVREWWGHALERAGLHGASRRSLVVDIRDWTQPIHELVKGAKAIKGQRPDVAQYIEGWSIVDTINGSRIGPEVAARLYEALDGARLVQTSTRFLARLVDLCPSCGCHGSTDVRIVSPEELGLELLAPARGPP